MRVAATGVAVAVGVWMVAWVMGFEARWAVAQAPAIPASVLVPPGQAPPAAPITRAVPPPAVSPASVAAGDSRGFTAVAVPVGDHRQALTVIDPQSRAIAVYHIDLATGEITLKSVRQITWDLQLTDFNSGHPLPGEVRQMFPPR